jgi:hypothetical protein
MNFINGFVLAWTSVFNVTWDKLFTFLGFGLGMLLICGVMIAIAFIAAFLIDLLRSKL